MISTTVRRNLLLVVWFAPLAALFGCMYPAPEQSENWRIQYQIADQTIQEQAPGAVLESISTSKEELSTSLMDLDFRLSFTFIQPSGNTYTAAFADRSTAHISSINTGSLFPPPTPDEYMLLQQASDTIVLGPIDAITLTWSSALSISLRENIQLMTVGTSLYVREAWQQDLGTPVVWFVLYTNNEVENYATLGFWVDARTGRVLDQRVRRAEDFRNIPPCCPP